ncbi:MAG: hypothetical protein QG620_170 [Patescibacteria group bacterium]|nr:hypothetical protein [Patescibacteria group bacterium]
MFLFFPALVSAQFTYTPMEKIPGFETAGGDFPAYILAIYRFGLWTVGIAALLMISVGGYMYITSAGNNAQTGKAKGIITDAIIGVLLALTSYLLLYTINPDLVQIKILSTTAPGTGTTKAECEKWCDDAGGNAEWTSSCKTGCSSNSESPVSANNQAECEKWCDDAGGNAEWTSSCKTGCSSGSKVSGTANCNDLNPSLSNELKQANNGVPPALLASFMRRECTSAMSNSGACATNNSYGAGGAMQFIDSTWKDYGCTGSKFNRQDALSCAAKKIAKDSGGNYSDAGIRQSAKRYCGSCTDPKACGGNYCDGIISNYNAYKSCTP